MSEIIIALEHICDSCGKRQYHEPHSESGVVLPEGWILATAREGDTPFGFLRFGDTCCPECEKQWIEKTLREYHA